MWHRFVEMLRQHSAIFLTLVLGCLIGEIPPGSLTLGAVVGIGDRGADERGRRNAGKRAPGRA
jgi:hypothetical protein